jgi:hypothetical protein
MSHLGTKKKISPRNPIRIELRRFQQSVDLVAKLGRRTLIGIEHENPR